MKQHKKTGFPIAFLFAMDMRKIASLSKVVLFSMLFIIFTSFSSSEPTIREFSGAIKTMKSSGIQTQITEASYIENLYYDIQPAIYLRNNTKNVTSDDEPVIVYSDYKSIGMLADNDELYKSVVMLVIKINSVSELEKVVDLNNLIGFTNLKYVVFTYSFALCPVAENKGLCEINKVKSMLNSSYSGGISVLYNISIPE